MGAEAVGQTVMKRCLDAVMEQASALPPDQTLLFVQALFNVSFQLLRVGGHNDEFVRGMLLGAMSDLDGPALLPAHEIGRSH